MSELGELRIDVGALRANARRLREVSGVAKTAFVVKANAYGHGLTEVALAIEPLAALICVYGIGEALSLRDGGITAPILVLGPVPLDATDEALRARIALTLWDTQGYLQQLTLAARRMHTPIRVHVKINTGMNRYGLEPHDLGDALDTYLSHPELEIAGIFSHLAAAEEIDSTYTQHQTAEFERALACARPALDARDLHPTRHLAASAAAMLYPATRYDLTRIGIALYGLWPSEAVRTAANGDGLELQPALSFLSHLAAVRDVAAGAPIGYGCTFHAPRAMRIGILPLGYADGIPRLLSNRGAFVVDGARCPIIGRIAMNATFLDLTPAPQAHAGTSVTLIGSDGQASVTADEWAQWSETINYEIVARLPVGLPRRFVGE